MTLKELRKITEEYFGVNISPVNRKMKTTKIRFLYYHTAHRLFPSLSLEDIGISGQTHATVLNGIKEFPSIVKFDGNFERMVDGYYKMLDIEEKVVTLKILDYDELCDAKRKYTDKSAMAKISQQKKRIKQLETKIMRLNDELEFYCDGTTV